MRTAYFDETKNPKVGLLFYSSFTEEIALITRVKKLRPPVVRCEVEMDIKNILSLASGQK